jgi:protein involved in polysaccharide export with SLBB domain
MPGEKMRSPRLKYFSLAIAAMSPSVVAISPRIALAQPPTNPIPSTSPSVRTTLDKLTDPIQKFDTLRIIVANEPNYSGEFPVTEDGMVTMPRVGNLLLAGLTRAKSANLIAAKLKSGKLLLKPEVSVYIADRRPRFVGVGGRVQVQGLRQIREGALLADVLEEAIPLADADLEKIELRKEQGGPAVSINFKSYRDGVSSDEINNPRLDDGDRVYVRARESSLGVIKIKGEIKDPTKSVMEIKSGSTVGIALQAAGGLTDFADKKGIVIQRGTERISVEYEEILKGTIGKDVDLKDKDELIIPKLERPRGYFVGGNVRTGPFFPLTTKLTIREAIAFASPLEGWKRKEIRWSTKKDGKLIEKKINLEKVAEADLEVQDGDVFDVPGPNRTPKFSIGEALSYGGSLVFILSQIRR